MRPDHLDLPLAARRHPLVGRVARRLSGRCGVPAGARLLLGCSGGADSTCLLICAAVLTRRHPPVILPVACHVHHHLRDEADEDADFVEAAAARLGVPVRIAHVRPDLETGNRAAASRRLRYAALRAAAAEAGAGFVAVGHQAEDQLETMIMALARGAGLEGLSAMAWSGPMPIPGGGAAGGGISLVRPLLDVSRAECEALCEAAGLGWRDDPTNRDPATARGRLRRDVLPVLEAMWPGAAARAPLAAELIRAAVPALERQVESTFGPPSVRRWSRAGLRELSAPLIGLGLRRALAHAHARGSEGGGEGEALGQRQLLAAAEAILDDHVRPRRFDWADGWRLDVRAQVVELRLPHGSSS